MDLEHMTVVLWKDRMTPDQERWAEALAIVRVHGDMSDAFIVERLETLSAAGDVAGIARWREISSRVLRLSPGGNLLQ